MIALELGPQSDFDQSTNTALVRTKIQLSPMASSFLSIPDDSKKFNPFFHRNRIAVIGS